MVSGSTSQDARTARHTPGPWERDGTNVWTLTPNTNPDSMQRSPLVNRWIVNVQPCNVGYGGADEQEREAVARLIQAAPGLLAVLETFVALETSDKSACHYCGYDPHTEGCLVGHAEAAIQKARGEG